MGEVKVLSILAGQLYTLDKNIEFCVTVMTETGLKSAQGLTGPVTGVGFMPLDYGSSIRRFLDRINPAATIFIETEIWPNMIIHLGRRGIPIFLANGRLSERASSRYRRARSGLVKIFPHYTRLMVQSEDDKERYIKIGADRKNIEVMGSLKFDAPLIVMPNSERETLRNSFPFEHNCRILTAGSTREGENEIILRVFKKLSAEFPDLRLILVPRHLDRLDEICLLASGLDISCTLYSKASENPNVQMAVVDRMGILNNIYFISDIAFVGGTLVEIGGHNILEPVWAGTPVLYGPSIHNVRDSSEYIIENGFGEMVKDESDILGKLALFFRGEIRYNRKESISGEKSRAYRTARVILNLCADQWKKSG